MTGNSNGKAMYGGTLSELLFAIDPLPVPTSRTLDATVGFLVQIDTVNGTAAWGVHGYNAYTADAGATATRYGNSLSGVALSGNYGGVYVGGFFTDGGKLMARGGGFYATPSVYVVHVSHSSTSSRCRRVPAVTTLLSHVIPR